VDTSAWIHFFRGRGPYADAVDRLLASNEVAICGPVIIELRRGFRSSSERARVIPLLDGCHHLADPAALWDEAGDLGYFLSRRGITAKTIDLLVAIYALSHSVALLADDRDFPMMRRAGAELFLVRP
jgi:predicted nucleic acid-binding protein